VAAFASLGLPGFSGFVAEFQVFTGSLAAQPVATSIAVFGILLPAALFLLAIQRMLLGPLRVPTGPGATRLFPDLRPHELASVVPLLLLALVIGVAPRFLLDVIEPASRTVVELVAR
jgi:NADH-quinone oxidoreductase subunit M